MSFEGFCEWSDTRFAVVLGFFLIGRLKEQMQMMLFPMNGLP
jgi:hypothetical protein